MSWRKHVGLDLVDVSVQVVRNAPECNAKSSGLPQLPPRLGQCPLVSHAHFAGLSVIVGWKGEDDDLYQ